MLRVIILTFLLISCNGIDQLKNHQESSNNPIEITSKSSVYDKSKTWTNLSQLNVLFVGGSDKDIEKVTKVASTWTKYANLTFNFYRSFELSPEKADIRVELRNVECNHQNYSRVGTDSKVTTQKNTLCLSSKSTHTILHEFGHALGLRHEHIHPDSLNKMVDNYISVCMKEKNWSQVDCELNFKGLTKNDGIFDYDKNSIMHYSLHHDYYTNREDVSYGNLPFLSLGDRLSISKIYPGKIDTKEIIEQYSRDIKNFINSKGCRVVGKDANEGAFKSYHCGSENMYYIESISGIVNQIGKEPRFLWSKLQDSCYESIESAINRMSSQYRCLKTPN